MSEPKMPEASSSLESQPSAHWSLGNRLLVLLLVTTTTLWLLVSLSMYQVARRQSDLMFDAALGKTAQLILAVTQHEMAEHGLDYTGKLLDTADLMAVRTLVFQIRDAQGQLLYRSANAPASSLTGLNDGYLNISQRGVMYRTLVMWDPEHRLQIQIADSLERRNDVVHQTARKLVLFGVVFLPATLFLIGWIVARSCAPLERLGHVVALRSVQQLGDVEMDNAPREVVPLIRAINVLLARIRDALLYERRFTADAAHELRTPLAALRAHAQVLQGARSADEAQEAAHDIIVGVDRSRRMLDQLLALARVDQTGAVRASSIIDLTQLVTQQQLEHQVAAEQNKVTIELSVSPAQVLGDPDELHILLRNLVDNALRYTPAGGRVRIGCGMQDEQPFLSVHDSGVGIPEAERGRVFERFYRINRVETAHAFGSGLGLSIVKRLVQQYQACIDVEEGLDGAGVGFVVRFQKTIT